MLSLVLPNSGGNLILQDVIDIHFHWKTSDCYGKKCKADKVSKTKISREIVQTENEIVILSLLIFTSDMSQGVRKIKFSFNSNVLHEVVTICNQKYKIFNVIFHHGEDGTAGHFTNMLFENNSWTEADDSVLY